MTTILAVAIAIAIAIAIAVVVAIVRPEWLGVMGIVVVVTVIVAEKLLANAFVCSRVV